MKKDTLFWNAKIHTGRTEQECFGSMLVRDGRIVRLYESAHPSFDDSRRSDAFPPRKTESVDLHGLHVYPCLIDPHQHLLLTLASMAMGFEVCQITAEGVRPNTLKGVEQKLRAYAAGKKKNEIIAASNYILSVMDEPRMPTKDELDRWCGNRPVVVYNIDGHSTSLSSAMLRLIGTDPTNHSGVLSGEENERAQGRIISKVGGGITLSALARGVAAVQNSCADYGIGLVGALEGNGDSPDDPTTGLLVRLARHFSFDVRLYLQYTDLRRMEPFRKVLRHPRIGGCGDWEMDGSVGSHSAAFSVPFLDSGCSAPCYYSREEVSCLVKQASAAGCQIASHAIGDLAVERLLDAYEQCPSERLNRIEHGEFLSDDSLARITRGNYAVVMQPGYSWIDRRYLHTYERFLPPSALSGMRLRSLYNAGVCVCASSDSPVQSMDPYLQMLGMVRFYNEAESLTPYEAFRCYTLHAARAMEEEADYGTLEPGKKASFFTATQDLFSLQPEELVAFRPNGTWYSGKKYRRKKGSIAELAALLLGKGKLL